jgi:hypothetical protein
MIFCLIGLVKNSLISLNFWLKLQCIKLNRSIIKLIFQLFYIIDFLNIFFWKSIFSVLAFWLLFFYPPFWERRKLLLKEKNHVWKHSLTPIIHPPPPAIPVAMEIGGVVGGKLMSEKEWKATEFGYRYSAGGIIEFLGEVFGSLEGSRELNSNANPLEAFGECCACANMSRLFPRRLFGYVGMH